MTKIIGFGGSRESGKTTAANILVEITSPETHVHYEFSEPIMEVGQRWLDGAKDYARLENEIYHVSQLQAGLNAVLGETEARLTSSILARLDDAYIEQLRAGLINRQLTLENKAQHRPLLEWLGRTALDLVSPTVWSDIVAGKARKAQAENVDLITIGGVRTTADFSTVKSLGGAIVRLHRGFSDGQSMSEYQINDWSADYDITNSGTIENLRLKVADIWKNESIKQFAIE